MFDKPTGNHGEQGVDPGNVQSLIIQQFSDAFQTLYIDIRKKMTIGLGLKWNDQPFVDILSDGMSRSGCEFRGNP